MSVPGLSVRPDSLSGPTAAAPVRVRAAGEEVLDRREGTLTRDRLDDLFQHCADLGVDIEWRDLGESRRGEYWCHADTIVLSPRLTRRQAVACLAHELGHQRFGHGCSTPANERRAWEYAAALLLTPVEYAAAEERVGSDAAALAIELAVTPQLVEAWRRWWSLRGHRPGAVA